MLWQSVCHRAERRHQGGDVQVRGRLHCSSPVWNQLQRSRVLHSPSSCTSDNSMTAEGSDFVDMPERASTLGDLPACKQSPGSSGGPSCSACSLPGRQPPTPLAVARGILAMASVQRVVRPLTRASEARIRNVSPRGRNLSLSLLHHALADE